MDLSCDSLLPYVSPTFTPQLGLALYSRLAQGGLHSQRSLYTKLSYVGTQRRKWIAAWEPSSGSSREVHHECRYLQWQHLDPNPRWLHRWVQSILICWNSKTLTELSDFSVYLVSFPRRKDHIQIRTFEFFGSRWGQLPSFTTCTFLIFITSFYFASLLFMERLSSKSLNL